jgi:hypothetical protein
MRYDKIPRFKCQTVIQQSILLAKTNKIVEMKYIIFVLQETLGLGTVLYSYGSRHMIQNNIPETTVTLENTFIEITAVFMEICHIFPKTLLNRLCFYGNKSPNLYYCCDLKTSGVSETRSQKSRW